MAMNDTNAPVVVAQADREAARPLWQRWWPNLNADKIAELADEGKLDGTQLVQAFARHRIAAQPAPQADEWTTPETENAALKARVAELEGELANATSAQWFYLGDDYSSEKCRFDINECISEDFEWDNSPNGNHVLQIAGARPVPDVWVALHYYTEDEKEARESDDDYTYTVHATEEAARAALESQRHD